MQPAFNAFLGARVAPIERKWPGFPAKLDHAAILFGHEHANFSIQNDGVQQRKFRPNQRTL